MMKTSNPSEHTTTPHTDRRRERKIVVSVNGRMFERVVPTRKLLVDFLREDLGLTGTHVGCEHGVCGACTINVNGAIVRSCLTFAVQVDGVEITTIEGVGAAALHPVQEAFRKHHGVQCGFCTPGMILTAVDLVERFETLEDQDIREALSGNICRCTGYQGIVAAVREALGKSAPGKRKTV